MNTKQGRSNELAEFAAVAVRWFKLSEVYDHNLVHQKIMPLVYKAVELDDWRPTKPFSF